MTSAPATAPATSRRDDRLEWVVADVGVPCLIRGAAMLLQLVLIAWLNGDGPGLGDRLLKWDGQFYVQIADSGYSRHVTVVGDSLTAGNDVAFHPLFPALAGLLHVVTRIPADSAVLTIAVLASLAASVAVHLLARHVLGSRRAGYLAAGLLGALPMAVTLQMGYAEGLFIALAAAGLLAALCERWWWAGGLLFLAGLTRPVALALAVVIPLTAWHLVRQGRSVPARTVVSTSVLGALGVPAYWVFLWAWTGRVDAWFVVEKYGWKTHFDWGDSTIDFIRSALGDPTGFSGLVPPVVAAVLLGYLLAGLLMTLGRWPLPIPVLTVIAILLALSSTNYWHSKPRLLLTAFLVVLPAAGVLARLRTTTAVALVAAGTFASAWFGAYMLDVWPYAI
jgi:hypothetical protein